MYRLACLVLLVLATTVCAQANIHPRHHHRNPNDYCAWTSAATVASHHGYPGAANILHYRVATQPSGIATLGDVSANLKRRGIPHTYQPIGTYDRRHLEQSTRRGEPVLVGITTGPDSGHAIAVSRYNRTGVRYYDPDLPGRTWTSSRAGFDGRWMGNALTIKRRRK